MIVVQFFVQSQKQKIHKALSILSFVFQDRNPSTFMTDYSYNEMSAISTTFSYSSIIFMHAPKKTSDYGRNILLKIGHFLCKDFN